MKVRNQKANHNDADLHVSIVAAVLASVKVGNLKANHNSPAPCVVHYAAVLASMKIRNLKANHNRSFHNEQRGYAVLSKCEGRESES